MGRLLVQKFGGTSVRDVDRINAVAQRVARSVAAGDRVVVVVSAMAGETDRLEGLGFDVAERPPRREMDVLLSAGEQVSIALVATALMNLGVTPVVAGFQGIDATGDVTTFGRGGSDTTAVAIAAAINADECQIYTDVEGVYTADPRMVESARRLDAITFEEMLELASLGAKVLHSRSVEFVGKYGVPLRVLSSFSDGPGTLITTEEGSMEQPLVSGIAHARDEAKLTVLGVPDVPGVASKILGPISAASIEVDMIVQNSGADGSTDLTFTVRRADYARAREVLLSARRRLGARAVEGDDRIAKVSAVGVGMKSHAGVATRMFDALAAENINIQMISTSEIKISVVVAERYLELAVRAIHDAFGLGNAEASEEPSVSSAPEGGYSATTK